MEPLVTLFSWILQNAFYFVNHRILCTKLSTFGIGITNVEQIKHFLTIILCVQHDISNLINTRQDILELFKAFHIVNHCLLLVKLEPLAVPMGHNLFETAHSEASSSPRILPFMTNVQRSPSKFVSWALALYQWSSCPYQLALLLVCRWRKIDLLHKWSQHSSERSHADFSLDIRFGRQRHREKAL